jgi:hypothetical protein
MLSLLCYVETEDTISKVLESIQVNIYLYKENNEFFINNDMISIE